ncbi:unnamed protein product [Microthlaspi erraticum]|uniref:TIR domain-containing protein n=1 Tax=Microthlaspi erraticum TaxID=1685480 RepID=A0A6D2KVJ9_9BRAS|nr:unnamed protein product [Microthlaspi erraticum]
MDGKVLPPQHQVFINFRGDELRNNFISHLVDAFQRNRINIFTDKQEKKGENISNLFKRIEESKIALAVLSKSSLEEECYRSNQPNNIDRWKEALVSVSGKIGLTFHHDDKSHQPNFFQIRRSVLLLSIKEAFSSPSSFLLSALCVIHCGSLSSGVAYSAFESLFELGGVVLRRSCVVA